MRPDDATHPTLHPATPRPRHVPPSHRRAPAAPFPARFLLAAALAPGTLLAGSTPLHGQAPVPGDTVRVDSAAVARADSARARMERPADDHPVGPVEVLEFPFKAALFPVVKVGRMVAASAGLLSMRDPPAPVRGIRSMRRWGLVPRIQTIGPNSGAALVMDLEAIRPFVFETGISVRGSQRHRAGLRLGDEGLGGGISYTFRRDAEDEFWGIGGDTPEDQQSDFLRDKQEARLAGHVRPLDFLRVEAGLAWEDNRVEGGFDGGVPDIQEVFDPDELVGLGERIEMGRVDLSTTLDFTEREGFQRRGVRLRLGAEVFRGLDGTDVDFHRFDNEIVGFLPLNSRQSLAARGLVQINRLDDGPGIPFFDLSRLGGSTNGPRSFEGGRFRDREGASLMAEWRYEIWDDPKAQQRVEGFLLFDEAAVGRTLTDLGGEDFHTSVGFGARVLAADGLVGLGYVAFGGQGPQFVVQLDAPF